MPNFQSKDINYPKEAYFAAVWIKNNIFEIKIMPFVFMNLFNSADEAIDFSKLVFKQVEKEKTLYKDIILIAKLGYYKPVELKKEYWNPDPKGIAAPEQWDRALNLILAFGDKNKFNFLVTPRKDSEGKLKLILAYAFKHNQNKKIVKFMKESNIAVDEEARTAALYRITDAYGYNIKTGQKIKDGVSFWEN